MQDFANSRESTSLSSEILCDQPNACHVRSNFCLPGVFSSFLVIFSMYNVSCLWKFGIVIRESESGKSRITRRSVTGELALMRTWAYSPSRKSTANDVRALASRDDTSMPRYVMLALHLAMELRINYRQQCARGPQYIF